MGLTKLNFDLILLLFDWTDQSNMKLYFVALLCALLCEINSKKIILGLNFGTYLQKC